MNQMTRLDSRYVVEDPASQDVLHVASRVVETEPLRAESVLSPSRWYFFSKRGIDLVLAALGLVVLLPVFVLIALCIKLDDGGPVLHFRQIIGHHGDGSMHSSFVP